MSDATALHDVALSPDHPLAGEVARLLVPIPGGAPGGADLRYAGVYTAIEEARRSENAQLPQGVWQREVKQADWGKVAQLCSDALAHRTKDLRIVCWLAEAWVHRFGFSGLAPGFALAEGLSRLFWNDLQPSIDGGDPATHIAAIDWLNQRLPIALRQVPVFVDASSEEQFTWSDFLDAQRLEIIRGKDSKAASRAEAGGAVTLAMIEQCADRTDTAQLAGIAADAAAGLAALATLDETLDQCAGKEAPGLSNLRNLVRDIADYTAAIVSARQALVIAAPEPAPTATAASVQESPAHAVLPIATAQMSRSLAYRQLEAIAAFLHENEPHSPVPYVLDQLVAWGRMPLREMEATLRDQGSSMSMLIEVLGMNSPEE